MQVRSNTHRCGNNDQILDDVLAFHGRHGKLTPSLTWQEHERAEGSDHMDEEKRHDDALSALDEKQQADDHFKDSEAHKESREWHEVDRGVEKILHHWSRRRKPKDLEDAEPKEDNKNTKAGHWNPIPAEKSKQCCVE